MSESESENHVGRLSSSARLCVSADPVGGQQDREVLGLKVTKRTRCTGVLGVRQSNARVAGKGKQAQAEAEAGGLKGHKERSHRVVLAAVRVND